MFSYVSAEQRVPADHPLRAIRALVDDVLCDMSREFDRLYARVGRPSIPPERLLRAQLLQIFYSISQRAPVDGTVAAETGVMSAACVHRRTARSSPGRPTRATGRSRHRSSTR